MFVYPDKKVKVKYTPLSTHAQPLEACLASIPPCSSEICENTFGRTRCVSNPRVLVLTPDARPP